MRYRHLLPLFSLLLPLTALPEPVEKEKFAIARMLLEKPDGEGVFGTNLDSFRENLMKKISSGLG